MKIIPPDRGPWNAHHRTLFCFAADVCYTFKAANQCLESDFLKRGDVEK